jgi:hypothetical protein
MNNTAYTSVFLEYLYKKFQANQERLGLKGVYLGNQTQIPVSPVVTIDAAPKRRDLAGVAAPGGRVDNYIAVYVDVMSSDVKSGEALARLELYRLADAQEAFLHEDVRMEGLLIHGMVTDWDPGVSYIQGGMWRTVRLTFIGRSKTYLSV